MDRCGYHFATRNMKGNYKIIKLDRDNNTFKGISIGLQDENKTIKLFLDALASSRYDEAKAYISRNYANTFDLTELSDYFCANVSYKYLVKVEFIPAPRNCMTKSILVKEKDKSSIIHLHMVKEPDKFGNWKIYGIDKE